MGESSHPCVTWVAAEVGWKVGGRGDTPESKNTFATRRGEDDAHRCILVVYETTIPQSFLFCTAGRGHAPLFCVLTSPV